MKRWFLGLRPVALARILGRWGCGSLVFLAACGNGQSSARTSAPKPSPTAAPITLSTPLVTYTGHHGPVIGVAWSPNGQRIATCGNDGTVQVWDAATGKALWQAPAPTGSQYAFAVAWSPDGKRIALGGSSGAVAVLDAASGKQLTVLTGQFGFIEGLAWSPSGAYLASGSQDDTVAVWNSQTYQRVTTYNGHAGPVARVAWSPDGTRIASASADETVQVWDAMTGKHLLTYSDQNALVWSVAWSPDGSRIASGTGGAGANGPVTSDNSLRVWDAATGKTLLSLPVTKQSYALAWSPDGRYLASGGDDNVVHLWDATSGAQVAQYTGHHDIVFGLSWSPDGQRIASTSVDGTAQVWKPFP